MQLTGLHHVTAVSADIRGNHAFYVKTLGMRLVKRSVNQDDTSAYHLFYADGAGSPGTDLTFFDWRVPRETRGTHAITQTTLRVYDVAALEWWERHLRAQGVAVAGIVERDGRAMLPFEDPEGQRLALVVDGGAGDAPTPWAKSIVPMEHQIRGLGPVTFSVPDLRHTDLVLQRVLGLRPVRTYAHPDDARDTVHVYEMGDGGPHAELHVAVQPRLRPAQPGAGGVHHLALRTPTFGEYDAWADRLASVGMPNSGPVDRYWFRSLYFREPNGILFEIATDGPGFAVDEDAAHLGEQVVLPPFLEPQRARIVAGLVPID